MEELCLCPSTDRYIQTLLDLHQRGHFNCNGLVVFTFDEFFGLGGVNLPAFSEELEVSPSVRHCSGLSQTTLR